MSILVKIAAFVFLLAGLVFIHELGHFIAAKLCKVKVLKFALGFGPRVWGFKRGETEYQIGALPLGGFVRMLGEDPSAPVAPEDRGRGFAEQKPYKRAFIAAAGPVMNLILPIVVFTGLNLIPQMQDPPIVARVLPNEPADRAGFLPMDRVVSVDGLPTRSFDEMREIIEKRPGQLLDVVVLRDGARKTLHVTPSSETQKTLLETTTKGRVGIVPGKLPSYVGVVPGSRAFLAGLRTFDRVIGVNGRKLGTLVDLNDALKNAGGQAALTIDVVRGKTIDLKTSSLSTAAPLTVHIPAGTSALGIESPDLYVREVEAGSPAAAAGLHPLDRITAAEGTQVFSEPRLEALIADKKTVDLDIDRAGQRLHMAFAPKMVTRQDEILGPMTEPDMGFQFFPDIYDSEPYAPSELVAVSYPPVVAVERGVNLTVEMTRDMVLGIGAIFTGRVSTKSIGGPIQMFQLSSKVTEHGWLDFLRLFAFISINLGIVNLIPVPVLDGFHIVLAAVEGISRRAVPLKVREAANWVGVAMLLALMTLAFKNDIFRVFKL